jgi:DnaJ-class molecular chaperone
MYQNEIECPECCGNGQTIGPNSGEDIICPHCNGHGWRAMTEEEENDRAADAYSDMCEGEPPITAQERHEAAWKQKQELRR